ncbi:hypothetical protein K435DRAFT_863471 [Dendrothele bispora CBS 962.96]|uniref:Uncharacterized protein n=1 Tax=Dendrothele bispora (strain CBS 962.96) TaxID=1314807 RepID=A0A4V4HEJ8_DENBC|nr:hypothetical protein K435DRAFT_863471 [Dendrothele bispora CBS 962.96]
MRYFYNRKGPLARGKHFPIGGFPGSTANSNIQIDGVDADNSVKKLVALDEARVMYMMLRAMGATRVVEELPNFILISGAIPDDIDHHLNDFSPA